MESLTTDYTNEMLSKIDATIKALELSGGIQIDGKAGRVLEFTEGLSNAIDFLEKLKEIDKLYLAKCEEMNRLKAELGQNNLNLKLKNKGTGLFDKNGTPINIGDKTRLVLEDGNIREFYVCFKTVNRIVKNHLDFDGEYSKVAITGIVFCWNGYDLFPCVNKQGVADTTKMEVIK